MDPPLTDETGEENGEVATVSVDEPLRALAFKIMDDRFGALTFVRIYSGVLTRVIRCLTRQPARPNVLVAWLKPMTGIASSAQANIIAIVGMKNVQTGHTLCSQSNPCTLEP